MAIFLPIVLMKKKQLYVIDKIFHNAIYFCAIALVVMNIIAIMNFILFERLPALGYAGSLVRFGSFWDDPNGFGFFASFFTLYFFLERKYLLSSALFLCLLFTVSFSSYLVFLIGVMLLSFKKIIVMGLFLVGMLSFSFAAYIFSDQILALYELKSGSIDAHLAYSSTFSYLPLLNSPLPFDESWAKMLFFSYFPGSVFVFILVLISFFSYVLREGVNIYELFIILFSIGNFLIPYVYSFPVNLIFCVYLALYLRLKKRRGHYFE